MYWQIPNRNSSPQGSNQQGFTLVEGLVVILIIGLAATVAIPNLQRVKIKTETQQAVYQVAGYVDLARSEALRRHSPIGIIWGSSVDTDDQWFRIFEDWDPAPPDAAVPKLATDGDSVLNGNEEVIKKDLLSLKITMMVAPPTGDLDPKTALFVSGGDGIFYKSDGSLDSGDGAAYFTDSFGNLFRLRINAVTGSPRIEKMLPTRYWSPKKEDWEWYYK